MNLTTIFISLASIQTFAATNWAQPPVACVEEIVPSLPDRSCLDLTSVANPWRDWPTNLDPVEEKYWRSHREPLNYCRSKEVLSREATSPGSQSAGSLELAWMRFIAVDHSDIKVKAIYESSRKLSIPAQVLSGALYQESLFSELGIAEDGGNYSCGIGQLNITEWCRWAESQSLAKKRAMNWPSSGITCGNIEPGILKPFYDIAVTRLNGEPEYKLMPRHFAGISYQDVVDKFPPADSSLQQLRFQAATSFINSCTDPKDGIEAKAQELTNLYRSIPNELKKIDRYAPGDKFQRTCQDQGHQDLYPLHSGWLLAVGMYNAGGRALDALAYYNNWTVADLQKPATWQNFTPLDMIEGFYWGGYYDKSTDKITFRTVGGNTTSWIYFKPCVLQRHIARVIQHATLPGVTALASSLEGSAGCAKSKFDPVTGVLIQSAVPLNRQTSVGHR